MSAADGRSIGGTCGCLLGGQRGGEEHAEVHEVRDVQAHDQPVVQELACVVGREGVTRRARKDV